MQKFEACFQPLDTLFYAPSPFAVPFAFLTDLICLRSLHRWISSTFKLLLLATDLDFSKFSAFHTGETSASLQI